MELEVNLFKTSFKKNHLRAFIKFNACKCLFHILLKTKVVQTTWPFFWR